MALSIATEIERDLISKRTREALRARRASGIKLGRPSGPGKSKLDKYSKYSTKVEIYPHKHCPVCNSLMEPDNRFCSEKCAYSQKKEGRGKKKKIGIFIVIYIAAIVLMIAFLVP